jgi:hypothetical protein
MIDLKLVEEFAGDDGRLRFVTTEAFLQRFSSNYSTCHSKLR